MYFVLIFLFFAADHRRKYSDDAENRKNDKGELNIIGQHSFSALPGPRHDQRNDGHAEDLADEPYRADHRRGHTDVFFRNRFHDSVVVGRGEQGKTDADDNQAGQQNPHGLQGHVIGQECQPDGNAAHAGRRQQGGRYMVGQRTRDRRQDGHQYGLKEQYQSGVAGRKAQNTLQIHGQQKADSKGRTVVQHRRKG